MRRRFPAFFALAFALAGFATLPAAAAPADDARRLRLEAAALVRAAEKAGSAQEREDLLRKAAGKLDRLKKRYPSEPSRLQLYLGGKRITLSSDDLKRMASARARAAARKAEAEKLAAARKAEQARLARQWPAGKNFRDCKDCPEMVVVPAGSFRMGSPSGEKGRSRDEGPQRWVTIPQPFAVGKYEVTFAEWDACVSAGGCRHLRRNMRSRDRGRHPVATVTWYQAKQYVRWMSRKAGKRYRLLSESEWEYAARAGTRTRYHWGDSIGRDRANCMDCLSRWNFRRTTLVGSFSANRFGLHDMHGNVSEWVEDCWHRNYRDAPSDGRAWTTGGDCSRRVLRGGSSHSVARALRSANRYGAVAGILTGNGFRVARTLKRTAAHKAEATNRGAAQKAEAEKHTAEEKAAEKHTAEEKAAEKRTAAQKAEAMGPVPKLTARERRLVQAGLASAGFNPGPADGVFGPATRAALKAWQAKNGVAATGRLTAASASALKAAGRKAMASAAKMVGKKFRDCTGCPEMVGVPAGSFAMGAPSGIIVALNKSERPQHRVTIPRPFAVGRYEVTFAEWDACVSAGGCRRIGDNGWGRGRRPVMNVSWKDVRAYVRWLSRRAGKRYRLLSESEWEYVARAGTRTRYHWGDSIGRNRANCKGCGSRWDGRRTAPAGSFAANRFGLHDMHGNVFEWVEDCWHKSYRGAPADGRAWTAGGNCRARVVRGGSWNSRPGRLRAAFRGETSAGNRYGNVGFRVARTLAP